MNNKRHLQEENKTSQFIIKIYLGTPSENEGRYIKKKKFYSTLSLFSLIDWIN